MRCPARLRPCVHEYPGLAGLAVELSKGQADPLQVPPPNHLDWAAAKPQFGDSEPALALELRPVRRVGIEGRRWRRCPRRPRTPPGRRHRHPRAAERQRSPTKSCASWVPSALRAMLGSQWLVDADPKGPAPSCRRPCLCRSAKACAECAVSAVPRSASGTPRRAGLP